MQGQRIATSHRLNLGMLSTYPPTACGLATFSSALERALVGLGHNVRVVQVSDGSPDFVTGTGVVGVLENGSRPSLRRSAAILDETDAVIIQHEYGIFGGPDGEDVLDLIRMLDAPVISVLHTVPASPTPNQRRVLEAIVARSTRSVVLTECARDRLIAGYDVDPDAVATIRHGAIVTSARRVPPSDAAPQVLSWGLLGPGKGLEHVIDAVGRLHAEGLPVRYTIAGMTHPKVVATHGERYRRSLADRAHDRGVAHLVDFDRTYRDPMRLAHYLATSAVIVLPYASTDQVVSGVLVDSIAAGRPIIATAFPHAVELLEQGAGIVVEHGDLDGLTAALRSVIAEPDVLADLTMGARRLAPVHDWQVVGREYAQLAASVTARRLPIPA